MSAFEDDSECAMAYQVLPTELKLPHRLHVEPKADCELLGGVQMTGRPRGSLVSSRYSCLRGAAGMLGPSSSCHGLPS